MTSYIPGDPEYRAYVGPFEQYDVMGATQFALLYALGIRQHHRLLDVGCGSLRAGRFFITYLEPGNYTGVEPNTWLVDDAIAKQTGQSLLDIKSPVFSDNDAFDFSDLGVFDFVVAQSIASHAGPGLVRAMLESIRSVLNSTGLAAVTFIHADPEDHEVVHIKPGDEQWPAWLYPGCFSYRREVVETFVADSGLTGMILPWYHPRQTWWLLATSAEALPDEGFRRQLAGATLAEGFEPSWRRQVATPGHSPAAAPAPAPTIDSPAATPAPAATTGQRRRRIWHAGGTSAN
jgi:SAM-dependent methyltransferase